MEHPATGFQVASVHSIWVSAIVCSRLSQTAVFVIAAPLWLPLLYPVIVQTAR